MSVSNSQDRINNGVESFNAVLRRRVRVSRPNLFIFLKHVGEVSQDTVGDWDRLTSRGCQIQRSKKTTAQTTIKTCVDIITSGVYARYDIVYVVGHTWTILSEQLDDVDDSDDNSSETYDVEEVMAVATINEASLTIERPEYLAVLCAAAVH